jgi:hypothetical protein
MNLSGLFGSAYRALDPILPFDGLLDPRFASIPRGPSQASTVAPLNPQGASPDPGVQAPQTQPARSVPQPKPHVSPWRVIDGVLGGRTISESLDHERARPQMEAMQQKMLAFASQLDPRERMVFLQSPAEWAKQNATRYGFHDVAGGNTIVNGPGGGTTVAPKVEKFDDRFGVLNVGQDGAPQAQFTDARGPTYDERLKANDAPEGFHMELDAQGNPTGRWTLDPAYAQFAKERAASGATRVNVPITLPAQNEFAKAFAGQYAADLSTARGDAESAQQQLAHLQEAKQLLKDGAITGTGANLRLQGAKALSLVGDPDARHAVQNTEVFRNQMQQQVFAIAKALGGSKNISDGDRKFAEQVAGADITLDGKTLERLLQIQQRDADARIRRFRALGQEAFSAVPPAQGLPQGAFGSGASAVAPSRNNDPLGIR